MKLELDAAQARGRDEASATSDTLDVTLAEMSQLASTLSRTQQEYAAQSRDRKAEQMTHARQVQEISMQLESALQKLERVQMQVRDLFFNKRTWVEQALCDGVSGASRSRRALCPGFLS